MYADFMSRKVSFVDPCYAYRCKTVSESDEKYVKRLKEQLDDEFQALGPDTVAAFFSETIAASTLACVPAVPGYVQAVREVCDRYGAHLVLDEVTICSLAFGCSTDASLQVMCGMGRSGTVHAWQQEGIRGPDIQTVGKSLGGWIIPLSAVLVHQKIFDAIAIESGALSGGRTFQAHPVAYVAALATQKIIQRDNLLQNVRRMGFLLEHLIQEHIAPLPLVGNIRGKGLFWAVEFMLDKERKIPFPMDDGFSSKVKDAALCCGVNVLCNMGSAGMYKIDTAAIAPPFTVTEPELVEAVTRLKMAIELVSKQYLVDTQPKVEISAVL
jgi:adenosylmethionine-8-amino-7-oxononanoate aminotransferase